MELKTLPLAKIKPGMRILMRIDTDTTFAGGELKRGAEWRFIRALTDVRSYISRGAVVVLVGHRGRPNGKRVASLSLKPVATWLQQEGKLPLEFIPKIIPAEIGAVIKNAKSGSVLMLENVRFHPRETKNCRRFAKELAGLFDVYVNNAFGVSHRKDTSVFTITGFLPSYAGSVLIREVTELEKKRHKPIVALLGGAKLETKLPFLKTVIKEADNVLLGGELALVFHAAATGLKLKINGRPIDKKYILSAKKILKKFENLLLPIDYIDITGACVHASDVTTQSKIIDIGPKTISEFSTALRGAETIIWNGTMGVVEQKDGQLGTIKMARLISKLKARSIVGGGDTVGFLYEHSITKGFDVLSTGGGAMLAFLAGEKLPGIEALKK